MLLAALGLTALVAAWVPPMQSPDEDQHLARAYLLAQGQWRLHAPPGRMSGGEIDTGLSSYLQGYLHGLAGDTRKRLSPQAHAALQSLPFSGETVFVETPGSAYYLPLVYLPQAAALKLGQTLDLSVHDSYRLARLLVQCSVAVLLAVAVAVHPPGPLTLGLLLLPMSLFQLAMPTLDGLTTAMALLALALGMRQAVSPAPMRPAACAVLALCLLVVTTCRLQLLPLLALPLALGAWQRSTRLLALGAVTAVLSLAWTVSAVTGTVDRRLAREVGSTELIAHYLQAPGEFLGVLSRTLADPALREFYLQSFLGNLGWLDTPLPAPAYPALLAGLALLALVSLRPLRGGRDLAFRLLLAVLAAASALLVFAALLVSWTPHPAQTIAGVQGRYFLVPALMGAAALWGLPRPSPAGAGSRAWSGVRGVLLGGFAVACVGLLLMALHGRHG